VDTVYKWITVEGISNVRTPKLLSLILALTACGGNGGDTTAPEFFTVAVSGSGPGTGRVVGSSDRGGLDCTIGAGASGCEASYPAGTVVQFQATPTSQSSFGGWGLDAAGCGSGPSCSLTVAHALNVQATFNLVPTVTPVASVTVTPVTATVTAGATVQLSASVKDAAGNVLAGKSVAWSSSVPAIATVGATTGLVTGISPGAATILATSEGTTGVATITIAAPEPPTLGAADVTVLSGQSVVAENRSRVTVHLHNGGGPGTYRIEFWGLPHSPNGRDFFFGESEPIDVGAGYDETLTFEIPGPTQGHVDWVIVYTRDQGSAVYHQSDRHDF
jgi:hypothetical protein